jgi:flavin-dependent dehydrogenase
MGATIDPGQRDRHPIRAGGAVDTVILGGGPAGAAAARLLAAWGHTVVVLTRPGARQPLAESLPPSAAKLLDRIGVSSAVDRAGFIRATGNTVWWGSAVPRVESFGGGALGWQVPRGDLDRLMQAEAERAGAVVVRGATVHDVTTTSGDGATSSVAYDLDGRRESIFASWVFDCTGRTGLLARRGWRSADPAGRTLALVGIWERPAWDMLADHTHTLVESYDGGWAWSVPVSTQRRYVTVMVDPALTTIRAPAGSDGLTAIYASELAKATQLDALARSGREPACLTAAPFARDASSYSATRFADDRILLVGDAASFIDPLSSYGIKKALSSAWLAAVVVHTALGDESLRSPALELYESRERAMYDGLRRRFAALSRDAGETATATSFWRARAASEPGEDGDPDVDALRRDADVLSAFDALRSRPSIALRPSAAVQRVERPMVRGDRITMGEHLVAPAFRDGIRYIRSVDLVTIMALASAHDQVPDLYAAYSRAAPPVPLPDFLGALSVLVGKGMLDLA